MGNEKKPRFQSHASVRRIESASGWTIELSPIQVSVHKAGRLRRLTERLCELDAIVARILEKGKKVTRVVPGLSSPLACRVRPSGVFGSQDLVRPLLLPRRVDDTLYPFQRRGVAFLLKNRRALLADDMGLGKTVQALAAVRRLIRSGRIGWGLVVAPRTLISNWVAESRRFAPELCVLPLLPTGDDRGDAWRRAVRRGHLLITSYEQFRDPPVALLETPPDLIIADEAHRLRRRESQSTQGFRTVQTKHLWALSGTPVERDAEDLAVLMSILDSRRFSPDDRVLHPSALRARARPYMLRRRKDEVLKELPPVIENEEELELTDAQRQAYYDAVQTHTKKSNAGSYLALFGELRSLCDIEPASGSSSKLDRICELVEDIAQAGEKAVVFSYLLGPLRGLSRRLLKEGKGHAVLTGDMPLATREEVVARFKNEKRCTVLLASSRIACEGLTLIEANHVVFVNRWWNPSANAQARDRVLRIGQQRCVWVWTFVCRNTIETRLTVILKTKKKTLEDLVESIRRSQISEIADLFTEP